MLSIFGCMEKHNYLKVINTKQDKEHCENN